MNKDVIYIEPEDDITDILSKLTGAEEKVVALVPPKKAGVLRSAVNIKLIAKTAKSADKAAVLVTADPTLVKMAATARVPVAKNLQSRPEIPDAAMLGAVAAEQVIDEDLSDATPENAQKPAQKAAETASAKKQASSQGKPEELTDDELAADQAKKGSKSAKKGDKSKKVPDIKKTRKKIIIAAIAGVLLIAFLVWALVFAPHVNINVSVKTTPSNLSENVNFTLQDAKSDPEKGLFVLEEQTYEQEAKVEFTATGKKDLGNKASGTLTVTATFKSGDTNTSKKVNKGARFSQSGLQYETTSEVTLSLPGNCTAADLISKGCTASTTVAISALESGEKYNIGAQANWSSPVNGVSASNSSAISGGSTNVVTVVQQSDIDTARSKLAEASEEDGYKALEEKISKEGIIIKDSFTSNTSNPSSTPAIGEEVKDGVKPTLTAKTVYKLYAVDRTQVEKYIDQKAETADDQRIYSYGEPIFDRFSGVSNGSATAKLKTTYYTGPKITEEEVLEKSKGKKIGEVQSQLNSINGVNVNIEKSYFWVNSVPGDPNKITININKEDSN